MLDNGNSNTVSNTEEIKSKSTPKTPKKVQAGGVKLPCMLPNTENRVNGWKFYLVQTLDKHYKINFSRIIPEFFLDFFQTFSRLFLDFFWTFSRLFLELFQNFSKIALMILQTSFDMIIIICTIFTDFDKIITVINYYLQSKILTQITLLIHLNCFENEPVYNHIYLKNSQQYQPPNSQIGLTIR